MSSLGEGSAAELAQKYKDKVLARKRGAGTHQPKFRGFSLGKSSTAAESTEDSHTITAEVITTTSTTTVRKVTATDVQSVVPKSIPSARRIDDNAAGLTEKYQERFKSRLRGAGVHQPDFRGFSLKSIKSSGQQKPGRLPEPAPDLPTEASEHRPVIEDTIDDLGSVNNFISYDSIPSPSHDTDADDLLSAAHPQESVPVRGPSKVKRKPPTFSRPTSGAPSSNSATATSMAMARKNGIPSAKRRRLIQEEADENEDPLPVPQNQTVTKPQESVDGKKKAPAILKKAARMDIRTDAQPKPSLPPTKVIKSKSLERVTGVLSTNKKGARYKNAAVAPPSRKLIQSVLEIEEAPVNEMEVIAQAVRDVVDKFIDSIEDPAMSKEMTTLRSELETMLIEQVEMLNDHTLLRASVRKATTVKKELRVRLLETQRRRQKTREELKRVRSSFEREDRARRRLEETHKFLTDLESLRDQVVGSDGEDEDENDDEEDGSKTGLQSLIATVSSRTGGGGVAASAAGSKDTRPGMLGTLKEFNQLLETMEKNLQSMPLVTHSQEASTKSRLNALFSDSDDDNADLDDLLAVRPISNARNK